MRKALEIVGKSGLRGMDAIVVQIASEFNATLVTLDNEMIEKADGIVEVKSVETLIRLPSE